MFEIFSSYTVNFRIQQWLEMLREDVLCIGLSGWLVGITGLSQHSDVI